MPVERVGELESVGSRDAAVDSQRFVLPDRARRVGDVEPIDLKSQLTGFTKTDRIVGAKIYIVSRRVRLLPVSGFTAVPRGTSKSKDQLETNAEFLISTTSLLSVPRERASCLPSTE